MRTGLFWAVLSEKEEPLCFLYLIKIFGCWEAIHNKLLMASLESDSRGLSSKLGFDKIRFHEIP